MNEPRAKLQAHWLMILCVLLWANAFVGIKIGLRELSFLSLTTLRFLFAALCFLPLLFLYNRKAPLPTRRELPMLILLAFLGGTLYHVALNFGEQYVPAGTTSLIIGSSPIFTAILASIFLKDRLGWLGSLGIVLAFGGLLLITWKGTGGGLDFSNLKGVLAVLVSTLGWAAYPILARNLVLRRGPIFVSAYMFIFGLLMMLPINDGAFLALGRLSPIGWGAVLFLSVFCTVLGYAIYNHSLKILGATTTVSYVYLIPVASVFFGWLILGEQVNLYLLFGAILVITGVISINLRGRLRAR